MLRSIRTNNLDFVINEFCNIKHLLTYKKRFYITKREQEHLVQLKERGWTSMDCSEIFDTSKACKEVDETFERFIEHVWKDDQGADNRLFGSENHMKSAREFHQFVEQNTILKSYMRMQHSFCTVMAGRIQAIGNNIGSGGGWHRDTAEYRQVKAIMYLTDVGIENGPFQFWEKSHHRSNYLKISKLLGKNWNERRFSDEEIQNSKISDFFSLASVSAPAGTIIMADTSGIHRGAAIVKGTRYAFTEYIWNNRPVPEHMAKLILQP
ncbi:MAG: phytanoyl-CoA dioxygenase family protein [Salibacteraceae bacterium]